MTTQVQQYKVIVCGASKTGKTSFVHRNLNKDFIEDHHPTMGVEIHHLIFNTTKGYIQFNVWDCSGTEEMKGLQYGYFINADCALVFIDEHSPKKNSVPEWRHYSHVLRDINGDNLPMEFIRNKIDLPEQKQKQKRCHIGGIDVSVKDDFNIERPFLYLARKLMDDENLDILHSSGNPPVPIGEEVAIDESALNDFVQQTIGSHSLVSTPSDEEM